MIYYLRKAFPSLIVPLFCLLIALGLLMLGIADYQSRLDWTWSGLFFWIAVLILFVPILIRLLFDISRNERIGLILLSGIGIYMIKVLHSPVNFTLFDEFLHWRTAIDIVQHGRLYASNPMLTVSPLYPGMEIVTAALMQLGGMAIYPAGTLVVGAGRLVLVLGLYLVFEHFSESPRIGSIAAIMYAANSNFIFFDSQYSYESLALPLLVLALAMVAIGKMPTLLIMLTIISVPITHHLTGYALAVIIGLWSAFSLISRRREWLPLAFWAIIATLANVGWSKFIGSVTQDYLGPVFQSGIADFANILKGEKQSRQLFTASNGFVAPLWERIDGLLGTGLIGLSLPLGWLQTWHNHRRNAFALTLALITTLFPASLLLRFTAHGWEIASRTSEFLFLGIAFTLAFSTEWALHLPFRFRRPIIVVTLTIIFTGALIAGFPGWARISGPYLVSADSRSIEAQGISDALWTKAWLMPHNRIAADRINRILTLTYGEQQPITVLNDMLEIGDVYNARVITQTELNLMDQLRVGYLVADKRLSLSLPLVNVYFEDDGDHLTPFAPELIAKFEGAPRLERIFDSGDISIYWFTKRLDF